MDFSFPAERVGQSRNQIIEWRGKPKAICVENGPEYTSGTRVSWADTQGERLEYTQARGPKHKAYIERYNRAVRHEWRGQNIFKASEEAQDQATECL